MISIRKPFDVVATKSLQPGDLISGVINTATAFGIVINPIGKSNDVIVIDNFQGKQSVYLSYVQRFGSDVAVKYNVAWSIVPKDHPYSASRINDGDAFRKGSIAISDRDTTMYVGRGHDMHDEVRIDLQTLKPSDEHPKDQRHIVVTEWSLWLDAKIELHGGLPLFVYSAPPLRA